MSVYSLKSLQPSIGKQVFIAKEAFVNGQVIIGDDSSIWPMAVVRGDVNLITIGCRTNIQDGSILHTTHQGEFGVGAALNIGDDVTIGHQVILHGCTVHNVVLVGMQAVVLDGAIIESNNYIGAGSLVPPGKHLESGYLWLGRPVKKVRPLTKEELEFLPYSAKHYVKIKDMYLQEGCYS